MLTSKCMPPVLLYAFPQPLMQHYATPVHARLSAYTVFTASRRLLPSVAAMFMSVVSLPTDWTALLLQICRRLAVSLGKLHSGIQDS